MEGLLLAREDITDKHVRTSFSAIIGLVGAVGMPVYASLYLPMSYRLAAYAVVVPVLIYMLRQWVIDQNKPLRRVLIVLCNHEAGYDANEAVAVADSFEFASLQTVWASVKGGPAPSVKGVAGVEGDDDTLPIARCPAEDFAAIYLVGGPGAANEWLQGCPEVLETRIDQVLARGGVVGACAAGVSALTKYVDEAKKQESAGERPGLLYIPDGKAGPEVKEGKSRIIVGGTAKQNASIVAGAMVYALKKSDMKRPEPKPVSTKPKAQ